MKFSSLFIALFGIFGYANGCSEKITVTECLLSGQSPDTDFSTFVGDYFYYGTTTLYDGTVVPRYVNPQSQAEFSVDYYSLDPAVGSYLAVSFSVPSFTNAGNTFTNFKWVSAANFGGDITVAGATEWYISDQLFNNDYTPDPYDWYFANYYPIRIQASFVDCPYYGFTYEPDLSLCSTYDMEIYSDCYDSDFNCPSCQNWGCPYGGCAAGTYKMGNLRSCQSCSGTVKNCAQCSDWQGCVGCDPGYDLVWSTPCGGNICQPVPQ